MLNVRGLHSVHHYMSGLAIFCLSLVSRGTTRYLPVQMHRINKHAYLRGSKPYGAF